ncbi:hypothetical protein BDQ17DRAFT_1326740 [Cyathus striatus]|nr:hypothetical protein BDQ17DRAFT_1326740 [Cyathus striatus]
MFDRAKNFVIQNSTFIENLYVKKWKLGQGELGKEWHGSIKDCDPHPPSFHQSQSLQAPKSMDYSPEVTLTQGNGIGYISTFQSQNITPKPLKEIHILPMQSLKFINHFWKKRI